jgi:pimeloyl-ACP methyl ester carboxylesterase
MTYRFMRNMFQKFAYHPVDEWKDVIPALASSAQKYYLFFSLGKKDFNKNLKALRKLYELEDDEDYYDYDEDTYDDYENGDDDEEFWDEEDPSEDVPGRVVPTKVLETIYFVHAAKELGYFLDDWQWLLDKELLTEKDVNTFKSWQTISRYIKTYGVTYDGGVLMKNFLSFVKDNRNNKKCRMFFVYGADDPWTGAAIPDPAADDPYVKKYIVPHGVHSGHLTYKSHYSASDKDRIISTVRTMLKSN